LPGYRPKGVEVWKAKYTLESSFWSDADAFVCYTLFITLK